MAGVLRLGVPAITLTVPYALAEPPFGRDPMEQSGDQWPTRLWFLSSDGAFDLYGLSRRSVRQKGFARSGVGTLVLRVDYARKGQARIDTEQPTARAMRTRLQGLDAWAPISTYDLKRVSDDEGRLQELTYTHRNQPSLPLGTVDGIEISLDPHWRGDEGTSSIRVERWVSLQTRSGMETHVWQHIAAQQTVRELLALLSMMPLDFTGHEVITGQAHPHFGDEWRELHAPSSAMRYPRWEPEKTIQQRQFPLLVGFFTPERFSRWLEVRKECRRVWQPTLGVVYNQPAVVEVDLLQIGIAVEAYGHALMVRAKKNPEAGSSPTFANRLSAVLDHIGEQAVDRLLKDGSTRETFVQSVANAYNGVKHANRELPEPWHAHTLMRLAHEAIILGLLTDLEAPTEAIANHASRSNTEELRNEWVVSLGWAEEQLK